MATLKISAMTTGAELAGTEQIPAVQSGANVKTTPEDIKVYIEDKGSILPKYVKEKHIWWKETSDVATEWTAYHGTISEDTTNYMHSPTLKNIKLTGANADSGLYATKDLGGAIKLTGKHIAFYYYIPSDSPIHFVMLHFDSSASSDAWTDYAEQIVYKYNDGVGQYSGWHLFTGAIGDSNWTEVGSPNYNNIKYVRIYTETDSTTASTVVVGPIYAFVPPNAKALVMLGMDGAYSGQKDAVSYANSKGIPVTLFIAESFIGGAGRLTLTDLQDIKRFGGNLIANYLYALAKNWQSMTLAEQKYAIRLGAVYLNENGFGDGAKICSPPGVGLRSEAQQRQIMNSLIDIPAGFNASESLIDNLWDLRSLYINISPAGIGAAALTSLLAKAVASRAIINELWHSPYDDIDGTQAIWEDHIDELKAEIDAGTIEVVTPLDIINGNFDMNIPCFQVKPSGDLSNVTGDGTTYTVVFATTIFDTNSTFDGTSTFTAPIKGKYHFSVQLRLSGLEAASTNAILKLITSNRTLASRGYPIGASSITELDMSINIITDMDRGDTAYVTVQVDGGTKVVDITAAELAWFSGHYIN